ncbi:hypothetical protein TNCV_4396711 [Trichonephila clavipes]|uniref:Uncharacterized protein n=1 Tax=Trichonephila clavipes TaxID=2585209 RepID=A0A8X7BF58_TRICX|nr:hypothetical protein TNCV_4396711 [Trichonephila clavipes]
MYEVQEFGPGDASRDLSFVKKGKFGGKEQRGIVGHCTGFVEVVFPLFSHDELSEILRWLEQIDVARMVDRDLLMQIWKNRIKHIDFVLKWLSRKTREAERDFCGLPIRRYEGCVVDPPLGFKRVFSGGERRALPWIEGTRGEPWMERTEEEDPGSGEREENPKGRRTDIGVKRKERR